MSGDYTRFTFDPVRAFSGVFKQQGRVSLDANFNEFEEILDRHSRAQMYDTVGQAVVPTTTPHGFEIQVVGGNLAIGQGRAYVDGIQVECFGDMSDPSQTVRDDTIGGVHGGKLAYAAQPFYYQPNYPALSATLGAYNLVYLDVWQREVTIYEEPALREPALNGADSDNRVQTAWQVKILSSKDLVADSCAQPPPSWDALVAASTARLTADATPSAPSPEPCVINPVGGYTGIENRLYRVEIHNAGTLGGATTAKFKWSRDNASLAATVLSIIKASPTSSTITVTSTGRDSWMRFEHDDHIELLDDWVEWAMRESGSGGPMARVVSVNDATGEIVVDQDLSTFAVVAGRHPRIRRWDRVTAADPLVQDVNPGTAIPLENGLTITFNGTATDTVHAGDYWVFSARTAEGTIDPPLVNEPPRGILHHFARLALAVTGTPMPNPQDCRNFWPPDFGGEGCCTVVVHPGEDIQKAIDSLHGVGGCVCLKMGVHTISHPLKIQQTNLTLHGEVPLVTVELSEGGPFMLDIVGPLIPSGTEHNISVMGIQFKAPNGIGPDPMIRLTGVRGGRIAECALSNGATDPNVPVLATGVSLVDCLDYVIESTRFTGFFNGISGLRSNRIRALDNTLLGLSSGAGQATVSLSNLGILFVGALYSPPQGIDLERNFLEFFRRGIQIGDPTDKVGSLHTEVSIVVLRAFFGCRVVGNVILRGRSPSKQTGVLAFAIACHVARCDVLENMINIAEFTDGGIIVNGGNANVERNEIWSFARFDPKNLPAALPYGVVAYVPDADVLSCTVRGNVFFGLQQAIRAVGGTQTDVVHSVNITENAVFGNSRFVQTIITLTGDVGKLQPYVNKYAAVYASSLQQGRIGDNRIDAAVCGTYCFKATGLIVSANRIKGSPAGVVVVQGEDCRASDNTIEAVAPGQLAMVGIWLLLDRRMTVERNEISDSEAGIFSGWGQSTLLESNTILRGNSGVVLGIEIDPEIVGNTVQDATGVGIISTVVVHEFKVAGNLVFRCGYHDATKNPLAQGIAVHAVYGTVFIDSCRVLDTGESANASDPSFTGIRDGLSVTLAGSARVHDCVVASKPLPKGAKPHANSRAIYVTTTSQKIIDYDASGDVTEDVPPFADATDNLAEQTADVLVEIVTPGELTLAGNRFTNLVEANPPVPTVDAYGSYVTATGNRVRSRGEIPSLRITPQTAISAVGNMTTAGATIAAAATVIQTPHPYANFNANA